MPTFYEPDSIRDRDVLFVYLRDIIEKQKRIRRHCRSSGVLFGEKFRRRAGFREFYPFDDKRC